MNIVCSEMSSGSSDLYRLLDEADKLDGYVSACRKSPSNTAARAYCQYVPWNDQSLAKKYSKVGDHYRIIILAPSAEGGMPHTRAPNIICLPAYFPESKMHKTLQHELIHISQRQNPEAWRKKGLAEGWVPVLEADLPEEWVSRTRLNPDTYDARFWAWEGRHVPLPVFVREDKPDLRDIAVRWWDLKEERLNSRIPSSFTKKYGELGTNSIEHPYELWAYGPM